MTERQTRIAIGAPVFNRAEYLEEAIESLLLQSYTDFALVVVDDCSTDATPEIVGRYAAIDPRVHYERNPERVGMVENWRRAFQVAVEKVPGFEYFAFASDHDVWHPLWLESMARELDADPAVVVAFPLWVPIREDGSRIHPRRSQRWETAGLDDPVERVRRIAPGKRVPNVIYGLFRATALERCGVYSFVLAPDRLLMTRLALLGTFKQVPRELWLRRMWSTPRSHQRSRLFRSRTPLHTYLPTGLVHAAMLFRWAVLEGRARPDVSRSTGLRISSLYLRRACLYPSLSRKTRIHRWAKLRRRWMKSHRSELKAAKTWTKSKRKAVRRVRRRSIGLARSAGRSLVPSASGRSRRGRDRPRAR